MSKLPELRKADFIDTAKQVLTDEEFACMTIYIESGGHYISPSLASGLYELFLNGSSCLEISKLNKGMAYGAILDARIRYEWDKNRDEYANELHSKIKDKVIKAQLETTGLITDALAAANKKHGDKLKKYIQTGDESFLDGNLNIDNIQALSKLTENLLKITGQDKGDKDGRKLVNLNDAPSNTGPAKSVGPGKQEDVTDETLDSEDAAKILEIMAHAKRKNGG